jgi:hypothetical protein
MPDHAGTEEPEPPVNRPAAVGPRIDRQTFLAAAARLGLVASTRCARAGRDDAAAGAGRRAGDPGGGRACSSAW